MKGRIYLDTNILVASYSDAPSNKTQKEQIARAFKVFSQLKDVELVTSMWAITEMVKVLILSIKMDAGAVAEIERDLLNEGRLHGLKIKFIDVSPSLSYDFKEFFYHIRRGILADNVGVGDTIHAIIVKNNSIENILTFDSTGFEKIAGLTVINPRDIKIP